MSNSGNYLSQSQTATKLGVTNATLLNWRRNGTGPRWYKFNDHLVRYNVEDLNDWIAEQEGGR